MAFRVWMVLAELLPAIPEPATSRVSGRPVRMAWVSMAFWSALSKASHTTWHP